VATTQAGLSRARLFSFAFLPGFHEPGFFLSPFCWGFHEPGILLSRFCFFGISRGAVFSDRTSALYRTLPDLDSPCWLPGC
jgi:hypothetical protein